MNEDELRGRIDFLEGQLAEYEARWERSSSRELDLERERDNLRYEMEDKERAHQREAERLNDQIRDLEYRLRDAERYDSRYGSY